MRAHVAVGARLLLVDWWMDSTHTQPADRSPQTAGVEAA